MFKHFEINRTIYTNNKNSNWEKILGFRNMQEKLKKIVDPIV